jgi:hypothetical protein
MTLNLILFRGPALLGTGAYRAIAAYFDDPFGDPLVTGLDGLVAHAWTRTASRRWR